MSEKYLGVPFDIHGGGEDLLFPHHEDEKAQTECAFCEHLAGRESVRYWVHGGFITVDGEKMGKSEGNFTLARDVIWPHGSYDPMALRMLFISGHYRSPINYAVPLLDEANARLDRIYNGLEALARAAETAPDNPETPAMNVKISAFDEAMDDDFNTAGALGVIFEFIAGANQVIAEKRATKRWALETLATLRRWLDVLGIRPHRAKIGGAGDSEKLVDLLLQVRQDVRVAKQYPISDKIRDGLKGLGYEVEDLPGGKSVAKRKQ
jgi:cysteinyl-tRNA synthetase